MPASHKISNPQGIHVGTELDLSTDEGTCKRRCVVWDTLVFPFFGGALAHALHTPPRLSNRVCENVIVVQQAPLPGASRFLAAGFASASLVIGSVPSARIKRTSSGRLFRALPLAWPCPLSLLHPLAASQSKRSHMSTARESDEGLIFRLCPPPLVPLGSLSPCLHQARELVLPKKGADGVVMGSSCVAGGDIPRPMVVRFQTGQ
jgi:hypothetical protein